MTCNFLEAPCESILTLGFPQVDEFSLSHSPENSGLLWWALCAAPSRRCKMGLNRALGMWGTAQNATGQHSRPPEIVPPLLPPTQHSPLSACNASHGGRLT